MRTETMPNNNNLSSAIGSVLGCVGGTLELVYLQYFSSMEWWEKTAYGILAAFLFAIAGKFGGDVYAWIKKQFKSKE